MGEDDDPPKSPDAPLRDDLVGLDKAFLSNTRLRLEARAPEFASDSEVWKALGRDSNLAVVAFAYRGKDFDYEPRPALAPGDTVRLVDPVSGKEYRKRIVGRSAGSPLGPWVILGIYISYEALGSEFPRLRDKAPETYLLRFEEGVDQKAIANSIEKKLISYGTQVKVFTEEDARWFGFLRSILRILQGFLAFGLLVSVAGLAIVSARSVYQRRAEIGTLRALGFPRKMVAAYFLLESSFVALLGILIGVGTATLAWYIMSLQEFDDDFNTFSMPAVEIGALVALVYLVSLAFTILPAIHAASLDPVDALRPAE